MSAAGTGGGGACPDGPVDLRDEFKGLISTLKFFADTGRFNVLDRIGFAQSKAAVEEAVYEALRVVRALESRAAKLKLKVERDGRTEEVEVTCIEYEKNPRGPCHGVEGEFVKVVDGGPVDLEAGDRVCCYTKPLIPGADELERLFACLDEDEEKGLDLARRIAALAFAWRGRSGQGSRESG